MIDRRQFLRRSGMGVGALALAGGPLGLLAACSSDDGAAASSTGATSAAPATSAASAAPATSGASAAPATSASSTTTAARTTLRMQSAWVSDAEFMGYYIAADKGYYAAENLDYTYIPGGPDVIPETTLLAGQAELALTTVESRRTSSGRLWPSLRSVRSPSKHCSR